MDQTLTSSQSANERQVGGTHYQDNTATCPHCGGALQHWDFFARFPYLVGQVAKYVLRFQSKNGEQDLDKAGHFLQKLKEVYYPKPKFNPLCPKGGTHLRQADRPLFCVNCGCTLPPEPKAVESSMKP